MKQHLPDPFSGMRPPNLPAALRQRLLSRARAAAGSQPPLVDRLWRDRRLRWAWATTVVLLLGVQLLLAAGMTAEVAPKKSQLPTSGALLVEPDLAPFLARHPLREEASLSSWRSTHRSYLSPLGGDLAS